MGTLLLLKVIKKPQVHKVYPITTQKFLKIMARIESGGDPRVVNRYGYMGKYQFSKSTLNYLGFKLSRDSFLNNEELQDSAMVTYMRCNERTLCHHIRKYVGTSIGDVYITKAGILAGSHTHGAGAVIQYLNSNGDTNAVDGNGVRVSDRIKQFGTVGLIKL